MEKTFRNVLPYKSSKTVAKETKDRVAEERKGEQFGLYSRWAGVNKVMRKYIRFGNVYLLAGLSGHGKSLILNILQNDFLDTEIVSNEKGDIIYKGINADCKFKVMGLHFCFEMSSVDEMLRTVSNDIKKSYSYILSSEYDTTLDEYNRISEEELDEIYDRIDKFGKRPLFFFETAGNLSQIYDTVAYFHSIYPNYKFVVSIDHTLLINKSGETTDIELMANTGNLAIALRATFGDMVILVGQMNSEIEKIDRLTKNELHYPQKSDIYAQSRVYHAADTVITIHRPELLKIAKYGIRKRVSKDLIHFQTLKARHGIIGNVWLRFVQNMGGIIPYEETFKENSIEFK